MWARRPRGASYEFVAELTGTTGENDTYAVMPVKSRGDILWLDPAGYELARSKPQHGAVRGLTYRSDYELATTGEAVNVKRIFDGWKRR